MLFAEFFALNFKLKIIRIRAEERRIDHRNLTGEDIIPRPGKFVAFGLFVRMIARLGIIMISMTALGYPATEEEMSPQGVIVLLFGFFIDMCGLIYIYLKSGFYRDVIEDVTEFKKEEIEIQKWNKINLPLASSIRYYWYEVISDIILHVYAIMLYTALWKYLNEYSIDRLYTIVREGGSAFAAFVDLFPMLLALSLFILMPLRIAYWLEDSMMAFSSKEKRGIIAVFIIVSVFSFAPTIVEFLSVYKIKPQSGSHFFYSMNFNVILTCVYVISIFIVKILTSEGKNTEKRVVS